MLLFEWTILLLLGAVILSGVARRIGVPYPSFLALGGIAIAFAPHAPAITLDPGLALALFVAPVLLDAAYDTSVRDLLANWLPVGGLVFGAVVVTTGAVALVARLLVPDMPWAAAIALGAIVAPPDAAAATAERITAPSSRRIVHSKRSMSDTFVPRASSPCELRETARPGSPWYGGEPLHLCYRAVRRVS